MCCDEELGKEFFLREEQSEGGPDGRSRPDSESRQSLRILGEVDVLGVLERQRDGLKQVDRARERVCVLCKDDDDRASRGSCYQRSSTYHL